jgi:sortase A
VCSSDLDSFNTEVLARQSIEESIAKNFVLKRKVLEDQNAMLSIESVKISGNISEGTTSEAMERGFWHFPTSSLPGQKGNVVIIGHRFKYIPPATNTFFNLDKTRIGDQIKINVGEETYTYIITGTNIAKPNDISVIQQTDDYRLTLITCTPLWTSEERLVITAKLDKLYKKV